MGHKRTSRTISPRTDRLLERIDADRGRILPSAGLQDLLDEVGESDEPKALLYLRGVLLDGRRKSRDAAVGAALRLLGTLVPHEWGWFDDTMRSGYLTGVIAPVRHWRDLTPIRCTSLVADAPDPRPLILLASAHHDGFVREAALGLALECRALMALPMVLLRLRDWVPEVRGAAHRCWLDLLPRASDQNLLHLIPLAAHLQTLRPTEQLTDGLRLLTQRLGERDGATLALGLAAPDPPTRRYCFRALLSMDSPDPTGLFHRALADPDPVIADWSVTDALAAAPADQRAGLLRKAAGAGRSRVQARALFALWKSEKGEARDAFEAALTAPGGTVREFAQWALKKVGPFDPAAFYREMLPSATGRRLAAAIAELGRWGAADDADGLTPYLGPANPPRLHAAAMRAVSRLAPEAAREHYESAITAPSRRVARVARDLVVSDSAYPGCAKAPEWAESAEHEHTRLFAVTIITRRCSNWSRLIALLRLLVRAEGRVAEVAGRRVSDWIGRANRSALTATEEEAREVERLLARCADTLPAEWAREIRFALR